MKHGIYTVYDLKAESFVQAVLMVVATDDAVKRDFVNMIGEPKLPFASSPRDYNLIRLGSYDLVTNTIIPNPSDPVANPVMTGAQALWVLREKQVQRDEGDATQVGLSLVSGEEVAV